MSGPGRCQVPGCEEKAPPNGLACMLHWCLLPDRYKVAVREAYVPGAGDQPKAYLEAARAAVRELALRAERFRAVPAIPALTVWQPWAWLLAQGTKPLENRCWPCPKGLVGKPLALHAGKFDKDGARAVRIEFGIELPPAAYEGGVVAIGVVDRCFGPLDEDKLEASPWYSGEFAWVFRDVVAFDHPVPAKGAQRVWTLPPDVARAAWYRYLVGLAKAEK